MDDLTLYVCDGDRGGPRMHPCRRVQEALDEKKISYDKVIAAPGNPICFLRKGSREELEEATGTDKLTSLKLPAGTVLSHSRAILRWAKEQPGPGVPPPRPMPPPTNAWRSSATRIGCDPALATLSFLVPGKAKAFRVADLELAKSWLTES